MTIRQLTPADATAFREIRLLALQTESNAFGSSYEEEHERTIERFAEWLKRSPDSTVFGAFDGDNIVGTVGLARDGKAKTRHKAVIWGMYTRAEYRGREVGRKLMQAAMAAAREMQDIEQVLLCVAAENVPAKSLYASFGFERFGYERNAMKVGGRYVDEEHLVVFL